MSKRAALRQPSRATSLCHRQRCPLSDPTRIQLCSPLQLCVSTHPQGTEQVCRNRQRLRVSQRYYTSFRTCLFSLGLRTWKLFFVCFSLFRLYVLSFLHFQHPMSVARLRIAARSHDGAKPAQPVLARRKLAWVGDFSAFSCVLVRHIVRTRSGLDQFCLRYHL